MPVLKSEFACPRCKRITGSSVQIVATDGNLQCANGHTWNDTATFYAENPQMEFKVEMPKTRQDNRTPLTIPIPIDLDRRLKEAYGAKMADTVTAVLWQMIEGHAMVVPESDVQRMGDHLGKRPQNAGELVGLVYAKSCEATDAKQERDTAVSELKAYEAMSPGKIVVDLGNQFNSAFQKARDAEAPIKWWLERQVQNALENNWF